MTANTIYHLSQVLFLVSAGLFTGWLFLAPQTTNKFNIFKP